MIRCILVALQLFCLIPALQAQVNLTFANGQTANISFPKTLCTYQWSNSNPGIGLLATGVGNIAPFKIINNGTQPVKATLTVATISVPARAYAYNAQGKLEALDAKTYKYLATIPVNNPVLQAMSPDGSLAYVLDKADRYTLNVVNTINNTVIGKIKTSALLPPAPDVLMMSPDGKKIYLLDRGQTKSVIVIDTESMTEERPIPLDPNLSYNNPMLTPDGTRLYIPSDVPSKVIIVDMVNKVVLSTLSFNRPFNILSNNDGSKITITSASALNTFIYKPADGSIITVKMPEGIRQSLIAANGNVYMKDGIYSQGVHVIDGVTAQYSFIKTDENASMALSPDGKTLYTIMAGTGKVKVINTTTNLVTDSVKIDASNKGYWYAYSGGEVSADGSLLYVTHRVDKSGVKSSYISVVDTKTKKVIDSVNTTDITIARTSSPAACSGNTITYNITVNPDSPVIHTSGQLAALKTVYGTPSASTSFTVWGTKINGGIQVTAPTGLEVSTDDLTFKDALTVGATGDIAPAKVYVRIKTTANVAVYTGSITSSSAGATDIKSALGNTEVTPAPLAVKVGVVEKTYGVTMTAVSNSKAFIPTGLKNGDMIDGAELNVAAGSDGKDPVNTYQGSVTLVSLTGVNFRAANYTVTPTPGDLNIKPAKLTVTAHDKRRGYMVANPVFTYKITGFVNQESEQVLTTLPVASTTATLNSQIGKYPINVSGASAANYAMEYLSGTLTIDAVSLIVPNTFTPNGDGINDTWTIRYVEQYSKCTVMVTDRNGGQVYYSVGYSAPWNGQFGGSIIPAGTYYYVVDPRNGQRPVSGSITVIK